MTDQEPPIDIVGGTPSSRRFSPLSPQGREHLRTLLGPDGALESDADRQAYAYDGTFLEQRPDIVVLPRSTEEVAAILRLAGQEGVPVVTRGAGSGLAGGSVPLAGGIALVLTR
ncbi:MAG TPA: FAD-binding protein, partial [Chloroflexota bacterium]|nr:FAD-binding protein [Chloroflexota bacterium]